MEQLGCLELVICYSLHIFIYLIFLWIISLEYILKNSNCIKGFKCLCCFWCVYQHCLLATGYELTNFYTTSLVFPLLAVRALFNCLPLSHISPFFFCGYLILTLSKIKLISHSPNQAFGLTSIISVFSFIVLSRL